jgi:hypothetical protein
MARSLRRQLTGILVVVLVLCIALAGFSLSPWASSLKDYLLAAGYLIPLLVSIGSGLWTYHTAKDLEEHRTDLARGLKTHETVLQIASALESRLQDRDIGALQDCQKALTKFDALCSEMEWFATSNAVDGQHVGEIWIDTWKTYYHLAPLLGLAPKGRRESLLKNARKMFNVAEAWHEEWSQEGVPSASDSKSTSFQEAYGAAVGDLDAWSKELRAHQMADVLDTARRLAEAGAPGPPPEADNGDAD